MPLPKHWSKYSLFQAGIQPHVTLHHSDLPQALEDEYGGWVGREIMYSFLPFVCKFDASRWNETNVIKQFYGCRKDFTAYADVCFKNFGDRVLYWTTMNEPNIFSLGGYDIGFLPPQRCSAPFGVNCSRGNSSVEPYIVAHHLLLSHASAARIVQEKVPGNYKTFYLCDRIQSSNVLCPEIQWLYKSSTATVT